MNHSTIKAQIYTSASWCSAESILFHSWSPRKIWGATMAKHFYISFNGENFLKRPLSQNSSNLLARWSNAESSCPGAVGATIKKSNFACVYMQIFSQYDSGERCGPTCLKFLDPPLLCVPLLVMGWFSN
jgi:hypothetical protein